LIAGFFTASELAQAQATTSMAEASKIRAQTLRGIQEVMGKTPALPSSSPEVIRQSIDDTPLFTRLKISYQSEPGDWVPAYLLIPKKLKNKAAAMVCLHQTASVAKRETAGLDGDPGLWYAKELAERGYVCIVPDYPFLGENQFDPYAHGYISCSMKGIVNHMRAIDVLQSLPEVDPDRIGVIGHSLGGHNALFLALFDSRIKAIVTSCGFTTFRKYAESNGDLAGWGGTRYMPKIVSDFGKSPDRVPFDFPGILIAVAPAALFVNAPINDSNFDVKGVRECISAASPFYKNVFHLRKKIQVEYPMTAHEFPADVRKKAYRFLDRWLLKK
jgi:dienelactone hydrolase